MTDFRIVGQIADFHIGRFVVLHIYDDKTWLDSCWGSLEDAEHEALKIKGSSNPSVEVYIMEVNHKVVEANKPQFEVISI